MIHIFDVRLGPEKKSGLIDSDGHLLLGPLLYSFRLDRWDHTPCSKRNHLGLDIVNEERTLNVGSVRRRPSQCRLVPRTLTWAVKAVEFRKLLLQASPWFLEVEEIRWCGLVHVYRLVGSRREYSVQIPVEATCS